MSERATPASFSHRLRVAFDDVDHAGIVYYPRFFHYFHLAFEELLFSRLADSGGYRAVIDERKIGFPAVHAEADYLAPLRFGEWFRVDVRAHEVGTKSVTIAYTCVREDGGTPCARGRVVCAVVDLQRFRAIEIPEDLRALFTSLT